MSRTTNSKKVNNIITSAKKTFVRLLAVGLAVGTLSGCGKKDVEAVVSTVSTGAEKVREESEKIAEKIDKVEKIEIPNLFSVKKYFAGDNTSLYDEEGKKVGTLDFNSLLKIIGSSEDGNWFKTEDGFLVRKSELNEAPVTHVVTVNPEIMYTQFINVRVHKTADKTSEVIKELPINQAVLKTGEVEFASGEEISKLDSSKDHGWSEIKFKVKGVEITGYVYTDYIGLERSETRAVAIEAPVYSDEEKAALNEKAKAYELNVVASTDEEYEELKNTIAALENPDSEKSNLGKQIDRLVADAEEQARKAEEQAKKNVEKARQQQQASSGDNNVDEIIKNQYGGSYSAYFVAQGIDTWSYMFTGVSYAKPYDHANSNYWLAQAGGDRQLARDMQADYDWAAWHSD